MDKLMNELTVITYVHPNEQHLDRCIAGLEQQSRPLKWVFLTHKKRDDIPEYDNEVEQIILGAEIKNKSAAYNFILPQIETTFIAFNDADDRSLKLRLHKQLMFMKANPAVSILGGGLLINDEKKGWEVYSADADIKAFMLINNPMVNSTVMLRNKENFWGKMVKYDETLFRAEDYQFWFDCLKNGLTFANLKEPLISYYQAEDWKQDSAERNNARAIREKIWTHFNPKIINSEMKGSVHQFTEKNGLSALEKNQVVDLLMLVYPNAEVMKKIVSQHLNKGSVLSRIIHKLKD